MQELVKREADYWQRFNALWLDLQGVSDDRDAVSVKRDVAARHLEGLRHTNVLEEAFHIWCARAAWCLSWAGMCSPASRPFVRML